ncbi:hypothetical protein BTVI_51585 [Pitangus sulphuratus]|nr:hypothetical protein BTVI_51585 [Pitangus sulphuratus]
MEELTKPLSIIFQQSWLTGEVPDDWKLANVMLIHKMSQKKDPGNYRPVSLTSVPGKVMEQIILSAITQHLQDGQGIRASQHGFREGRSCLTNLISFHDQSLASSKLTFGDRIVGNDNKHARILSLKGQAGALDQGEDVVINHIQRLFFAGVPIPMEWSPRSVRVEEGRKMGSVKAQEV